VRERFAGALVSSLDREELLRALDRAVTALLRETSEVGEMAAAAEAELRTLTATWGT
jgi:hypothetical protein